MDTTPSLALQPEPPPDFDQAKYPILARHWFGVVVLDLQHWLEQPVELPEIRVPELV